MLSLSVTRVTRAVYSGGVSIGLWICGADIQIIPCSPACCTAKDSLRLPFFTLATSYLPLLRRSRYKEGGISLLSSL